MRTLWLLLLGCATSACVGNFSNDDLEFLNALPAREDLMARLPGSEARTGASGEGPRVGRLSLGESSPFYRSTHEASDLFNAGLDALLSRLELIQAEPPTTRSLGKRVWGPMKLDMSDEHEVRLLMTRNGRVFDYRLEVRRTGSGDAGWWTFLDGVFQADGGMRRGTGAVHLRIGAAVANGFDLGWLSAKGLEWLSLQERLDIVYQTRTLPLRVEMNFVSTQASPEFQYTYRKLPDGLGEMRFFLRADLVPGQAQEGLSIVSRWTKDGDGVAQVAVTGGDVTEGLEETHVECWDTSFQLTYRQRSWKAAPEGSPEACPDVSALGP
ncbi:hypothetical protein [Cystobacter ferrugineus]|uniref:Lipoprotein n=1 Tax=Cystobacter ferrugineus TaxID=83449 RepID=A0A1L9B7V7_9BACT|nr:hypothetical protein [Cystobacter ferrugineus]OJH38293.1 hypothetical protein BON30_24460 [Cystobacter ferrugineus]